jgi:hypothetical protein
VATVLLQRLTEVARRKGIRSFTADVLPENGAMLMVLRDAGALITKSDEGYVLHLEIDLPVAGQDARVAGYLGRRDR